MVTQADLAALQSQIDNLSARITITGGQCSADLPHGDLVFQRGPNRYLCRCGKIYTKNGQGGLMEVT